MSKKLAVGVLCFAFLCGNAMAQDAKTVIANAQKAMGDLKSITYSGSAKDVSFQQCGANAADMVCKGVHNPMRPITNYVRVIDLTTPLSRATGVTNNIGGGGSTTAAPGVHNLATSAQQADVAQPWNNNSIDFYITPWGFLKGASANATTTSKRRVDGKTYTVLSWHPTVKAASGLAYTINGYVDDKTNLVDRVETWLGDNIMGDMHINATYSGWKDMGGVMAPTKIVQTRGGWPYFDADITAAKANPTDLATLALPPAAPARGGAGAPPAGGAPPAAGGGAGAGRGGQGAGAPPAGAPAAGRGAAVPPVPGGAAPAAAAGGRGGQGAPAAPAAAPAVTAEKLGDGLYRLSTGAGSYDSLIVEFKDYVMMLEAGQAAGGQPSDSRAIAYIAETKKLMPNKPIKYVFNTHPHSDHTGGLPGMVAEGATILTHKNNEEFFERGLNTPRTLLTDSLAKNPKKAKVEGMGDKKVFSDGNRTVEFYYVPGAPHSNGLMIAYIPKEKVLFQGDFSVTPGQPANDHVKALGPVLDKLGLDYDRYINVHVPAAPQTKADVVKALATK